MSTEIAAAISAVQKLEERARELEARGKQLDRDLAQLRGEPVPATEAEAEAETTTEEDAESAILELEAMKLLAAVIRLKGKLDTPETAQACEAAAEEARKNVAADANEDTRMRAVIRAANAVTNGLVDAAFQDAGFAAGEGATVLSRAQLVAHDERLREDLREHLAGAVESFRDVEEEVVMVAALGREAYEERKAEQEDFERIRDEVEAAIDAAGDDQAKLRDYVMGVQRDALPIMERIRGAPRGAVNTLSRDDKLKLMRVQSVQMMIMGGGHGHSHDGKPCGGHDHSHSHGGGHDHSHSHGGGHDHSHSHGGGHDHSHSHGGGDGGHSHSR